MKDPKKNKGIIKSLNLKDDQTLILSGDEPRYMTCLNLNTWSQCINRNYYYNIFKKSNFTIIDGFWTHKLVKLFNIKTKIYPGPNFFLDTLANQNDSTHGFLGSTNEIRTSLVQYIQQQYKITRIHEFEIGKVEVSNFHFSDLALEIIAKNCKILWISLGAPKQEEFSARLCSEIIKINPNQDILICPVGAAFDFYSPKSKIQRCPIILRRLGLEFFWRMIFQFRKTFKRLLIEIKNLPKIIYNEITSE